MNPIKISVLILLCFSSKLTFAQQPSQLLPLPLENQMIDWLAGSWTGQADYQNQNWSEKMVFEFDLDRQFLAFETNSDSKHSSIIGKGFLTIDSEKDLILGYYANNQRNLFKGKGMISNDMISIVWYDQHQKITQLVKRKGPNGMEIQNTIESTDGRQIKLLVNYNRVVDFSGNN